MTNKLDLKAIANYSNSFSIKICNEFFAQKEVITGSEILNLTAVDQLNMFIIKALFVNWKSASKNYRSPYFDFENEKVKEALQNFMNIASQHIAVKKADFLPLVSKATAETLVLALHPAEYFEGVLRDLPDFKCTSADLAQLKKYVRINTHILDGLSDKIENDSVFTNQALIWLSEISDNSNADDADMLLNQLSNTLECTKAQFFKNKTYTSEEGNHQENASFFDTISATQNEVKTPAEPSKIEIKLEKPISEKIEKEAPTTLNEQFQTDKPTVNDHLKDNESKSIVDLHQNAPIQNLAGNISLNQRFVFINKLFNGDSTAYTETLQILENCSSTDEALNLLKYKYAAKYQWNLNSVEADELMDILKRKA